MHMPADNSMAFVVVTHQSPHRVSLLPEILEKRTSRHVLEAADGMPIEPNCLYVAPPNRYLFILHATLYLLEAASGEVIRLAQCQQEGRAILISMMQWSLPKP
jgi:two-component system CheB/CheR fusion protein